MVETGITYDPARFGRTLSYLGRRGWELVTAVEKGYLLFKRPVEEGAEPEGGWAQVWTVAQMAAAYEADKT